MTLCDTNALSNFCDSHLELIYCNERHPGTSEIFTQQEIVVRTHFHVQHGTKTILVFSPIDGEAYWLLLPSSVSLVSGSTVQPENTYFCILKVTSQV